MFKKLRRRPSPGTALAGLALFVAMTGTAAAQGVPVPIITSPDQLASNVVTGPKIAQAAVSGTDIAQETISDNDLKDPQLKVRAIGSGAILPGSDGTVVRTGIGSYRVTFSDTALNANGGGSIDNMLNNNCAFSAVARNKTAIMSVDGPVAALPNSVIVRASFPDPDGLLRAVDTQFDVLASC